MCSRDYSKSNETGQFFFNPEGRLHTSARVFGDAAGRAESHDLPLLERENGQSDASLPALGRPSGFAQHRSSAVSPAIHRHAQPLGRVCGHIDIAVRVHELDVPGRHSHAT